MRNLLIMAGVAGLAAAIAMYFVNEANKSDLDRVLDAAEDTNDEMNHSLDKIGHQARRSFNAMS